MCRRVQGRSHKGAGRDVLDFATSRIAVGKVRVAMNKGAEEGAAAQLGLTRREVEQLARLG